MRLIDADALVSEIKRRRKAAKTLTGLDMVMLAEDMPTVEAVPLEPLCEKLAEYYHAPCNYRDDICETDENGDCPGIGKPDAECWKHIIRQWMGVRHGNE